MTRRLLASVIAAALSVSALALPSLATVMQPDGTVVPVGGSLQSYLTMRGESIDAVNDAAIEPQRFVPGCTIRFTVVVRDTSYTNSFGWYNVTPGRAPMASELYELVSPTAPMGYTATLDVRTDSRYMGGQIGFYLQTPPGYVYYSERDYQPDRAVTGGFVHVLIYDSRVTRNAFYFGWEDLYGGGDNDFQDLLMIVDNLVCAGGGAPCNTGEPGVCASGVGQCRNGMLTCMRVTGPSPERCDGLDNDCNGMTDDDPTICPTGQVCDRGVCVNHCVEMSCDTGQVCSPRGTCVDIGCDTAMCRDGERCIQGMCIGACDGVVCPHGQACRAGRCIDPCAGVTCDPDQICVDGVCGPRCPCRTCASTETCDTTSGRCNETACASMTCPAGQYCSAGSCVDACTGAHCPAGQVCTAGTCTDAPTPPDAGVTDSGSPLGDAGGPIDSGARTDARVMRDATGDHGGGESSGGCACRTPARDARGGATSIVVAALALAAWTRRKRTVRS